MPPLRESVSEVSHFIPEPRNSSEVTKLSYETKKPWSKATLKQIKNLINNQYFLVDDQEKNEPVTPCMDVYKAMIQFYGSLNKLKLRIVVRGDLQNKELVRDTWSPTVSMRTLKYFFTDATKYKARVHQLDFIRAFLQAKFKNRVIVKLDIRCIDYFLKYANYFGRTLILLNSMYVMTNYGQVFDDELIEWLLEAGVIQSKCQMFIYYNYTPDRSKMLPYLMLMTVSIGIYVWLLENGLWIL